MEHILFERRGDVGLITFNRPQQLNALNSAVIGEGLQLLQEIAHTGLRCLVFCGAGDKAFIAGADIAQMQAYDEIGMRKFIEHGNELMHRIEEFHAPSIAAINGFALGGGLELALACDIRLASESAAFAFPEVGLGIFPGFGGMQRCVRVAGISVTKELVYTGKRINAQQALGHGIVNHVYPSQEELLQSAMAMAEKIAVQAPLGVQAAKSAINAGWGLSQRAAVGVELMAGRVCNDSEDKKNAMTAFVEKRKPDPFVGR